MLLLLKLAFRNLSRNRSRTILSLTMIIGAFTSIVLFKGFSNYMLWAVEDGMTMGQSGHIQIATSANWAGDTTKPKEDGYLNNPNILIEKIKALPHVVKASGRANVPVLLSNADKTIGAFALGFDPKIEDNVEKVLLVEEGKNFSKQQDFEVLVGAGLQKSLQLSIGQTLSVVSQNLEGSVSSVELEVRGVVKSGFLDLDNTTIYVPLAAAQKLLATNRVEKIAVLLDSGDNLDSVLKQIQNIIKDQPNLVAKSWKDSAVLFRQVSDFYSVQNLVVEFVLSILVFFGILNTVGMSIYERIGEIGTMRALGDQTTDVLILLLCEALFLGLIGAAIGIPMSQLIAAGFTQAHVELVMPGASLPIPIRIEPHLTDFLESTFAVLLTCFISSFWPARKAVKLSIVDALRSNS